MRRTRLTTNSRNVFSQKGLTLLEMLVAVAVLAIILTTVAPSIQSVLIKNKITADINNLSAVLQRARFTAVDEQASVILCPTTNYTACTNSWKNAMMVFADVNGNGNRDNSETLIVASDALNSANTIYGITGSITFDEQGGIDKAATITVCPKDNDADYASALLLSLYGRISVAVDSDGDGSKEDLDGDALACS
ncbi:GspH/FimT family pseudopilin [Alteromonas portus]|uniref:GspH/FimT family pseudopilin n=1 Tax=Alteromonas portus TaxID=2565549 RepID=UPI003BF8987A